MTIFHTRTDYGGFQIDEHRPGYMLAGAGLTEESVETVVTAAKYLVGGHLSVRLNTMFQAI